MRALTGHEPGRSPSSSPACPAGQHEVQGGVRAGGVELVKHVAGDALNGRLERSRNAPARANSGTAGAALWLGCVVVMDPLYGSAGASESGSYPIFGELAADPGLCPGESTAAGHGLSLLAIDHVLTDSRCAVLTTSTYRLPGSDHRADSRTWV
jgi:hypothetical protein